MAGNLNREGENDMTPLRGLIPPITSASYRNPYIKRPPYMIWTLAAAVGWFMAIVALTVGAWLLRLVWG